MTKYEEIYEIVKKIPLGKVTTYGSIAEAIGIRSSARFVGYALNAGKNRECIPFHRVVNRNGELSGKIHFPSPNFMKELLVAEGVEFKGEKVDMKRSFWSAC